MIPPFPAALASPPSDPRLPGDVASSCGFELIGSPPAEAAPTRPPLALFDDLLAAADDPCGAGPAASPVSPTSPRRPSEDEPEQADVGANPDPAALIVAGALPPPPAPPPPPPPAPPAWCAAPEGDRSLSPSPWSRSRELYPNNNYEGAGACGPFPSPLPASRGFDAPAAVPAVETAATTEDRASAVFAGPPVSRLDHVVTPVVEMQKNTMQSSYPEFDNKRVNGAGMEKAKAASVMRPASAPSSFATAAASRRVAESAEFAAPAGAPAPGNGVSATPAPSSVAPVSAAPTPTLAPAFHVVESAPASTPLPAAAVRLIERVEDVAERVAARSSDQVSVSLDLDGSHRVEVKVALRDGRVFADFRTDSPEMRTALTHAWDGFVRGREGSERRWAEPVFAALGAAAAAPRIEAPPAAGFSSGAFGGESSPQQDAAADHRHAPRHPPAFDVPAFAGASASASRGTSSVSPTHAGPRADPSRLLSAVA